MEILKKNKFHSIEESVFFNLIYDNQNFSKKPFNDLAKNVLHQLSSELLSSPYSKRIPQLVALGFWLRPAQLNKIYERVETFTDTSHSLTSRGMAFHLPPQNVDTLFVYSWALSFLSGNINIVRLPSELSDVTEWLVKLISKILEENNLEKGQIFCRYNSENSLTSDISKYADLRMIWGGDEKVNLISHYPTRPDGISLGFPNRNSFCILSSNFYSSIAESEKNQVVEKLYNDIFWFDQMGCGSPKAIFWLDKISDVANDLYKRLDDIAERKEYEVDAGTSIAKFGHMNMKIATGEAFYGERFSSRLSVLNTLSDKKIFTDIQGAGMIYDIDLDNISQISKYLDQTTQTITHAGLDCSEISELTEIMSAYGGYRLVPLGEALTFSEVWDGIDLIAHMTRKIRVKH